MYKQSTIQKRLKSFLDRIDLQTAEVLAVTTQTESSDEGYGNNGDSKYTEYENILQKLYSTLHIAFNSNQRVNIGQRETSLIVARILNLLKDHRVSLAIDSDSLSLEETHPHVHVLEVAIMSYCALVIYNSMVESLLNETLPISNDIYYWDEVNSSFMGLTIYSIQTIPARIRKLVREVYNENSSMAADNVAVRIDDSEPPIIKLLKRIRNVSARWITVFKKVVGQNKRVLQSTSRFVLSTLESNTKSTLNLLKTLSARSSDKRIDAFGSFNLSGLSRFKRKDTLPSVLQLIFSPQMIIEKEVRSKKEKLIAARDQKAWALGKLVQSSQTFSVAGNGESLVRQCLDVFAQVFDYFSIDIGVNESESVSSYCKTLIDVIEVHIPEFTSAHLKVIEDNGKPSLVPRYWPLMLVGGVASVFSYKYLINNWRLILEWAKVNVVDTVKLFVKNWIVEPSIKILRTIRHDENSRIALISKKSLQADLDSLERMVVDFASDFEPALTQSNDWRERVSLDVKEGDLTSLMKPYEEQIRSPVSSLVRGTLIRSLLIQLQKTKVDVDTAVSGIDQLLKSQELVFGIVAILPSGLLTMYGFEWLYAVLVTGRSIRGRGKNREYCLVTLGEIEKCLISGLSSNENSEQLDFKNEGLLLCEVNVLRATVAKVLPKSRRASFLEDLAALEQTELSVEIRLKMLQRIWHVYRSYL